MSLDSVLNKDGTYYPQVSLKDYEYIKKKVISYIIDNSECSSDDSDEEQIKAMKLMFLEKKILQGNFEIHFWGRNSELASDLDEWHFL